MKKNLVLIGMMGSGKSTIGALISDRIGLKFVDTDFLIEKQTNLKIRDIFKKKGENFFRKIEEKITINSLKNNESVISTGGGSFINEKVKIEIKNKSISFWLKWNEKTLIKRIKNSKKRPNAFLLTEKELSKLINERNKHYSKADYKINCDSLNKNEIAEKIINIYEKK